MIGAVSDATFCSVLVEGIEQAILLYEINGRGQNEINLLIKGAKSAKL